jgi:uncharacterized protein (DUF1501 family)
MLKPCTPAFHSAHGTPLTLTTRRGALKASMGTALGALLGPTLSSVFGGTGQTEVGRTGRKSVILLWLEGGPCQQDSFDPKTSIDPKYGYIFRPIRTTSPEVQLASCLPRLARHGDDLCVVRSMISPEFEHSQAQYFMQTGWRITGTLKAPAIGSIVARELGTETEIGLPPFVSIGTAGFSAGYFGPAYRPTIVWDPNAPPENLGLPQDVSLDSFQRRLRLLQSVEEGRPQGSLGRRFQGGRDAALRFMRSEHLAAFDLSREPQAVREAYGETRFERGCLLARRLVESGVRFVQVRHGEHAGYDTHAKHYPAHEHLLREFDGGMAQLLSDLKARGLLESTVVIATGEFGRTPKINANQGRDHWLRGWSLAVAGGGFRGGFVYGKTTKSGGDVAQDPVSVPDFMATLLHTIGVQPEKEYYDDLGRPNKLVDDGNVVHDLLT